jgi:hypothetical protein
MATRLYTLNVITSAGTAIAAPLITTWALEDNLLQDIEVFIPNGHNGATGIRVLRSQQQVAPWGNNSFLIANDATVAVPVGEELTESKLVIQTYNTGSYDHTFYLRAAISDLSAAAASTATPDLAAISQLVGAVLPS